MKLVAVEQIHIKDSNEITNEKIYENVEKYVGILKDKLAYDITVLDVSKFTPFEDYFIVCTARNSRHLQSLSREIIKKSGFKPGVEGMEEIDSDSNNLWVLIDLKDIVLNICTEKGRKYYRLDSLYVDADELAV